MKTKYQIDLLKNAVVGVDQPMKALSMHIQKQYSGKLAHKAIILSKKIFFGAKLFHAYVQFVYIVKAKYQIAPSKAVVGVDRPMKEVSMHIQKPY